MTRKPKIGLLPLYLKLYDEAMPDRRAGFTTFLEDVTAGFKARGLDVAGADVCRVAEEFKTAVAQFEAQDVDAIVTLHLAYSPSLESIAALTGTSRPIVILDTTMDASFDQTVDPDRIMYNHGIHGVMDLASMLRREGKAFEIVAGHVADSNVLDRASAAARAAYAARELRETRALRIGEPFKGMGDFTVDEAVMKDVLGIAVDQIGAAELIADMAAVSEADIDQELAADRERFNVKAGEDVHRHSVHVGLALRRRLDAGGYGAFSANFLAFDQPNGPVMPFLEISKAMARGIGYGGEGDVLTASLVGALARAFGDTTFTEIFCPDWKGNSLFLSHMGEINPDLAPDTPDVIDKDFPWAEASNPAAVTCGIRPGPGVFVNLTPGPRNTFDLIVAPVEMLADTTREDMKDSVRAWMRPVVPVADFLEAYSRHGGTHHSALAMGDRVEELRAFAAYAGLACTVIG